jgi:biopolymer transport protein ExbB
MNAQRMAMSVASWYLILSKGVSHVLLKRRGTRFIGRFWAAASFATAIRELEQAPGRDLFTALVREGVAADAHYREHCSGTLGEACTHSEFVTRALRNSITSAAARLESGLTILASVGSTAPFVGLFGTVWAIYHALLRIGQSGQATIDHMAGPVGEALIMTAFGLAVAIPAVLAYNAFTRGNRVVLARLDALAHDLHAYLTTGARIECTAAAAGTRTAVGTGRETAA